MCLFLVQVLFLMMREMFRFAVVLLLVMLGFTLSFHALFRTDDTYGQTWLNLFKAMLGEVGFFDEISEDRYENRYKSVATVLLVVYFVIITIVLLNLLIAVLSTSHAKVQEHADQEYKVLKARLIKHYRFVVQNDLLPAPFNLVQLPFRWNERAMRCVGYVVFWLVVGIAAVVGGGLLWVVSALLAPFPQFPTHWQLVPWKTRKNHNRLVRGWCQRVSMAVEHFILNVWRVVGCPLHLFGWWLTRPIDCVRHLFSGCCCCPEIVDDPVDSDDSDVQRENAYGSDRWHQITVDEMLRVESEPSVRELLKFLVDPLGDDTVRDDERTKATTVEHMKLLRYRLESTRVEQINLLQDHIDMTINKKMDTLHEGIKAVDDRLNDLVKSISHHRKREEEAS